MNWFLELFLFWPQMLCDAATRHHDNWRGLGNIFQTLWLMFIIAWAYDSFGYLLFRIFGGPY